MPVEPAAKRAVAFFDGQNIFHAVKAAFGYSYPNYEPRRLAATICREYAWDLTGVRFYTGVPAADDSPFWNHFWSAKLAQMGRSGIYTFVRTLRYRHQTVRRADGSEDVILVGQEKGIDVRIALDIVRLAHRGDCDVALVFSQDNDLSEVADEIRTIAREQLRWIKIASAFPSSPAIRRPRGIEKTDWIPFDRRTYDACIDTRDYRPKEPR